MQKKKKILFLITQSEIGGAQQYLLQLIPNLSRDNYDIALAASALPGDLFRAAEVFQVKTFPLQFLQREINFRNDVKAFRELRTLLREWSPDIVQLHSTKVGFLGALACRTLAGRLEKIPRIIYRIGGFSFFENVSKLKKLFYFFAEWISAFWKDVIIVNNANDFQTAKNWHIGARKLILIPNGFPQKVSFLDAVEARRQLGIPEHGFTVGAIAHFYSNKDFSTLLRAMAVLKSFSLQTRLVIIGDGAERKKLEMLINDLCLENDVMLLGERLNAAQYLKAFDVFALSSEKEGMPWVVLEAFAAEVPVVATAVGGVPEMIEHRKEGFLVPPQNPEAMAKAIRECLLDSELQKLMIEHAKERLHRDFSLESMVQKTISLYA